MQSQRPKSDQVRRIVVLISGRGSNLQSLIEASHAEQWATQFGAQWSVVISNRPQAAGLTWAQERGLPTEIVDHRSFETRDAFDDALAQRIAHYQPDLIILAGFMRVLGERFVKRFEHCLINIHPALLPAFPGLDTHARALQAKVALHGATVHRVSPVVDAGEILAQAAVRVMPGDTATDLGARVLAAEHELLPLVVRWWLMGQLCFDLDGGTRWAASIHTRVLWRASHD
jgi:phosphoribosylglycinamide formyltransferase-1